MQLVPYNLVEGNKIFTPLLKKYQIIYESVKSFCINSLKKTVKVRKNPNHNLIRTFILITE